MESGGVTLWRLDYNVALEKVGLGLSMGRGLNQLLVRRRGVRGQACRT